MDKKQEIKKPFALQALIYSFLLAPFGNIAMTAATLGIIDWYKPAIFSAILTDVQTLDYIWLGLVFLSGVLLMIRHRTAWLVAITSLAFTICINLINLIELFQTGSASLMASMQITVSLFTTLAVSIIFFYFRYPYLDRRATLFGFAARVNVNIPCRIQSAVIEYSTDCISLSVTGARFQADKMSTLLQPEHKLELSFSDQDLKLKAVVIESTEEFLRIKFSSMTLIQKSKLKDLIKSSNEVLPSLEEKAG